MQKEAGPMPTPKTSLQSTQSNAIFKGTENGEKKEIEVFLMAEIMISGRVWKLPSFNKKSCPKGRKTEAKTDGVLNTLMTRLVYAIMPCRTAFLFVFVMLCYVNKTW